jgi:hypothetical protein
MTWRMIRNEAYQIRYQGWQIVAKPIGFLLKSGISKTDTEIQKPKTS